jgi:hypothetical protein
VQATLLIYEILVNQFCSSNFTVASSLVFLLNFDFQPIIIDFSNQLEQWLHSTMIFLNLVVPFVELTTEFKSGFLLFVRTPISLGLLAFGLSIGICLCIFRFDCRAI